MDKKSENGERERTRLSGKTVCFNGENGYVELKIKKKDGHLVLVYPDGINYLNRGCGYIYFSVTEIERMFKVK